jgi:hypothetical protein
MFSEIKERYGFVALFVYGKKRERERERERGREGGNIKVKDRKMMLRHSMEAGDAASSSQNIVSFLRNCFRFLEIDPR